MSEKKSSFEPEEEHENLERWLLTYADMITLLTAFFILLYSMSVLNVSKFQKLAVSVRSGFNGNERNVSGPSIIERGQVNMLGPAKQQLERPSPGRAHMSMTGDGPAYMASPLPGSLNFEAEAKVLMHGKGVAKVSSNSIGWVVELAGEEFFFPKDSAILNKQTIMVLKDLANILPANLSLVGAEGFSSASPAGGFDLSTRRALAVVDVLRKNGVPESELSATGFGVQAPAGLGGRDYVRVVIKR